jgi:hypothetical protein
MHNRHIILALSTIFVGALPPHDAKAQLVVTPSSLGPVQFGSTTTQASAALGLEVTFGGAAEPEDRCGYADWEGLPHSLAVMTLSDTIVRVSVQDSTVLTAEGAGVGTTELQLQELYAGRVEVTMGDGNIFTVTPPEPADSGYRLIFQTNFRWVTSYRAGLLPAVRWVEGCS